MVVLIKNGLVIDPKNNINAVRDILIENGYVSKVEKNIKCDSDSSDNLSYIPDYIIDASNMIVSPGFVDLHTNFCDPGATSREDLKSGSLAAAKGGFTTVVLGIENQPSASDCNVIEYINNYSSIMPINIYPAACVTLDRQGEEPADIYFLSKHGAISFYDGAKPITDKLLYLKILDKCEKYKFVLSIFCEKILKNKIRGILEGDVANELGVKNATHQNAEYEDLKENLELANESNVKLDLAYISDPKCFQLIETAKNNGKDIFCEVQALNIILNEKAMKKSGTNAKVLPPLRSESDRKALLTAIKNGLVDCISSNHMPITTEYKDMKFKEATPGAIGLETVLGICGKSLIKDEVVDWSKIIEMISLNPATLYNLDKNGTGSITVGTKANITIFDPNEKWTFEEATIVSKSHNSPLIGTELMAKVKYTIANGKLVYKDKENI